MKEKVTIVLFLSIIYGFFLFNFIMKDEELSFEERRHLKQFPEITISTVLDGSAFKEFETYTLDQFPFRNTFRSLKANVEYSMFQKLDNNGIYIKDNKIFKMEYPLKETNIKLFTKKVNQIYDKYLQGMNVYYMVIPDKNYYVEDEHLKMDYENLYKLVRENMKELSYIEVRDLLSLEHYYDTDTHWKQEKIIPVARRLEETMIGNASNHQYEFQEYKPFYGVYYGQAAIGGKGETLTYLINEVISQAFVENKTDLSFHEVYNLKELGKMDSYNVFLSGSTPFITIQNEKNKSGRELVIFRDSFASSLTPLLIDSYSKITLIDLRYMGASKLEEVITFENQDVLFLYSTMVINKSVMLKD